MPHSVTSILAHIRSLHAQMPQPGGVSNIHAQMPQSGDMSHIHAQMPQPASVSGIGMDASVPGDGIGRLDGARGVETPSFTQTLKAAMEGVNSAQHTATALAEGFERGDPGADLAQVMVSAQQAQVAFRATVEVRNRLVQAYQDVLNMPL